MTPNTIMTPNTLMKHTSLMVHRWTVLTATLLLALTASAQHMDNSAQHSPYIQAVDEYLPAPGQFVNTIPESTDDDTPATMAAKCTEYIAGNKGDIITLGAYGGYVTFHFDHSIANIPGQRDLYIKGNSHSGNSEPGIIMVSKDVNGNRLPDDPWYEIAGSADTDSAGLVVFDYEITYQPNPLGDIRWTDSQGGSGIIPRNTYHTQEYFPLWHEGALTFRGTLLPPNGVNTSKGTPEYWILSAYRYGYADNAPNSDIEACSIDLGWAVDEQRQPVNLDFIDFVRIYNGVNQQCGWIGETSTEVAGAEDLHLEASLKAITDGIHTPASARRIVSRHTIDGTSVSNRHHGLTILRYEDGTVEKRWLP